MRSHSRTGPPSRTSQRPSTGVRVAGGPGHDVDQVHPDRRTSRRALSRASMPTTRSPHASRAVIRGSELQMRVIMRQIRAVSYESQTSTQGRSQ